LKRLILSLALALLSLQADAEELSPDKIAAANATIIALQGQRNEALDRAAAFAVQLELTRAELAATKKELDQRAACARMEKK
jgi:hypothetical protein